MKKDHIIIGIGVSITNIKEYRAKQTRYRQGIDKLEK